MQCILHSTYLRLECLSFALRHAIYVKKRLTYTFIKKTPFEALTGHTPKITHVRTFRCRVYLKYPGNKKEKLDHHSSNGIFVDYTATMKNIYYIDDRTANVKIGVRVLFDEEHFTAPIVKQPIAAQVLQLLGYSAFRDEFQNGNLNPNML